MQMPSKISDVRMFSDAVPNTTNVWIKFKESYFAHEHDKEIIVQMIFPSGNMLHVIFIRHRCNLYGGYRGFRSSNISYLFHYFALLLIVFC